MSLVEDLRQQAERNGAHRRFEDSKESEAPPEPWEPPIPLAEVPAAQPFPLGVLPAILIRFIKDAAGALTCPVDYLAVPLLALAGAAIGASRVLRIKGDWFERPCLYAAVIGPPGSAKSPALKLVAKPFYDEQGRRMANYRRRLIGWEEEKEEGRGPKPKPSTIYVNDITCEALASILQDNPRGVALIRDELTAWVMAMDQYKSKGRGSDRQFYLAAWAGEPVAVHRKMQDDPIYVPHPFVSVCGCLPPDLLGRFQGEQVIADGFLDRLLFSSPEPTPVAGENWLSVSPEATAAWSQTLSKLWELEMETGADGEKRPQIVSPNSAGREAWQRFTMALANEVNAPSFPEFLRGPWSKMKGYCVRLSLIGHYLRMATGEIDSEEVDEDDVDRAAALIRYFQSHARKTYAALDFDPEIKEAELVLRWIEREGRTEFKRWEVHKDLQTDKRFQRIGHLDPPLRRLAEHRYIRVRHLPPSGGRPPDPIYEVNPYCKIAGRTG